MNYQVIKSAKTIPGMTGAVLINNALERAGVFADIVTPRGKRGPEPTFSDRTILKLGAVSFAASNPDFIDIGEFHTAPEFYARFLGENKKLPSEPCYRQRLDAIGARMSETRFSDIWESNRKLLRSAGDDFGRIEVRGIPYTTVDMDVSPFINVKTHKEGIGRTYKKEDGFAPMFAYIGSKGLCLGAELREGNQHCQKGTPEFLEKTRDLALDVTTGMLLFCYDSGNDSADNMRLLVDVPRARFIGKHNFRRTNQVSEALHLTQIASCTVSPRPGKKIYTGSTFKTFEYTSTGNDDPVDFEEMQVSAAPAVPGEEDIGCFMTVRAVFEITERTITHDGQYFLEPEYEIDMWFTNFSEAEASDKDIIELYHRHGTSEQYHSETKTDMDMELLPSGKFATNHLILLLGMLGFNALRIIEMIAREMSPGFPIHYRSTLRRRHRTIIERLVLIPAHVTFHARKICIDLGNTNPWADVFLYVDQRLRSAA